MSLRASHVMSTVPTSCMQVESTVLPVSIDKVWPKFRALQLDVMAPTYVTSTKVDGEGVGSIVTVTYTDETVWELRITEISVSCVAYASNRAPTLNAPNETFACMSNSMCDNRNEMLCTISLSHKKPFLLSHFTGSQLHNRIRSVVIHSCHGIYGCRG
jgi:hypothetical protein